MSDTPRTDAEFEHVNNLHNEWVCSPQNAAIDFVEADFARQLERELQDAQARVRLLIAERDSARAIADQNWKLRDEFTALLGTNDVREAALLRFLIRYEIQRCWLTWIPRLPRFIASTIASRSIDRAINTMQAIKRDSPERYAELLEALK